MARPEEPTLLNIASEFFKQYNKTPRRLKVIDVFLVYILLTGIIQFVYCALVGTFPFNSFLAGFISCIGLFVLTGNDMHISDLWHIQQIGLFITISDLCDRQCKQSPFVCKSTRSTRISSRASH
eukprot:GEZU01002021.1.p1 GENE.GEZU01002021.1~~GEZU01002021.1.p1  ORF type:complete len:137 (-),score=9.38 GEZU01002021.1:93-464(-)